MAELYKKYKVQGDKVTKELRSCPKCGQGYFMAQHQGRTFCGRCHYTEFGKK